ncbi:predicted protein [Uncinocarpus reesii 1704]|uniref:Uncharacterized protein n=1 Tax=Uncinocarpus reesii (strain UAMH 1704) TaxID=336963 RepID=C4JMA3_UNCRE|nr:uncharacterized protein UREG_03961 [Uncinocarpus reesii 1704]EEP79115.1 predicted protein [Uncinocarpus reesii 1704]
MTIPLRSLSIDVLLAESTVLMDGSCVTSCGRRICLTLESSSPTWALYLHLYIFITYPTLLVAYSSDNESILRFSQLPTGDSAGSKDAGNVYVLLQLQPPAQPTLDNSPIYKAMKFRSKLSRLKESLSRTRRKVTRWLSCDSDKEGFSPSLEKRPLAEPVQRDPFETLTFKEDNAIPVIEPFADLSSPPNDSAARPRGLNNTQRCECQLLFRERLREVMVNSLMPALEEFRSCHCGKRHRCVAANDALSSSGYDTMSTTTFLLAHRIRTSYLSRVFGKSLETLRNEPLSCFRRDRRLSLGPLPPRPISQRRNERNLIVPVPRGQAIYMGNDESGRHIFSRCTGRLESEQQRTSRENVMSWINTLPDVADSAMLNASIYPQRLRRKRRMSNLKSSQTKDNDERDVLSI